MVWKKFHTEPGGRDTQSVKGRTNGPEHPTHYADIDEERPSDKKTLRELSLEDDANLSVKFWQEFYDATGHTASRERGCLPFRVWQFFNEMRDAADRGDVERYVCAAGLLAHYVGDACQPLHGSVLADGYKDRPKTVTHTRKATAEEYTEESNVGAGVHSLYESKMIDRYMPEILSGIPDASPATALRPIVSGWARLRHRRVLRSMGIDHPEGHALFTALGSDPRLPGQKNALVAYHSADGGLTWDSQPVSLGRGHDHPMSVADRSDAKRTNWLYVVSSLDAYADNGVLRFGLSVSRSRNGGRTTNAGGENEKPPSRERTSHARRRTSFVAPSPNAGSTYESTSVPSDRTTGVSAFAMSVVGRTKTGGSNMAHPELSRGRAGA